MVWYTVFSRYSLFVPYMKAVFFSQPKFHSNKKQPSLHVTNGNPGHCHMDPFAWHGAPFFGRSLPFNLFFGFKPYEIQVVWWGKTHQTTQMTIVLIGT